ncbi:MAG: hypothetical protein P1V18_02850 [Candidatus Gracilibacteria bacterium]|nr:hypothetical protein [Candidatus Gracilibacteria bacterium]
MDPVILTKEESCGVLVGGCVLSESLMTRIRGITLIFSHAPLFVIPIGA